MDNILDVVSYDNRRMNKFLTNIETKVIDVQSKVDRLTSALRSRGSKLESKLDSLIAAFNRNWPNVINNLADECDRTWTAANSKASDVRGCEKYKREGWCTSKGKYGPNWKDEWGTFEDYADSKGRTAWVCPQCGRCRVDGAWGKWEPWHPCATCGEGRRVRMRYCDAPAPSKGGRPCVGEERKVETCNIATPCQATVRLANGNTTAGRVEILFKGTWGTICDDHWGLEDAQVICRQLGLGDAIAVTKKAEIFGQGTGDVLLDNMVCTGDEWNIGECRHRGFNISNCKHSEDAGVICGEGFECDETWTAGNSKAHNVKNCETYSDNKYCTKGGHYGPNWRRKWGTFEKFADDRGRTALVCPQCGCV